MKKAKSHWDNDNSEFYQQEDLDWSNRVIKNIFYRRHFILSKHL